MDNEEDKPINPENQNHLKKTKKKKFHKRAIKIELNDKVIIPNLVKVLIILIVIILIINIYHLIALYFDVNKFEFEKNITESNNEHDNIKLFNDDKNPDNKNVKTITEENQEPVRNTSLNATEEIEKFVKSQRRITQKEIDDFRKLNSENLLYDRIKYKQSESPDVSIILTMSNQAHCIHKALRSIQNQSLKNIEIIISIDCSLDNSTEVIKQYMKEDERIILIEHDVLDGIMKTRCDGFKIAKGKYVTALDGDDAFIQKDILNNSLHIAQLGDLDIVEFVGALFKNEQNKGLVHYHKVTGIMGQPQLRTNFFSINEEKDDWRPIVCRSIWSKLIKNSVMQKVLEKVTDKYTNDFLNNYEDTILTVSLYQIAQSYYMYKEYGYYYSRDERSGRYPNIPEKKCPKRAENNHNIDGLKFLNYLYDIMDDNEIERQTLYHEIISINAYDFSTFSKRLKSHFDLLYRVVDGIIDSKYLTEQEKEKLRNIKNDVKKKEESEKN